MLRGIYVNSLSYCSAVGNRKKEEWTEKLLLAYGNMDWDEVANLILEMQTYTFEE